MEMSTLRVKRSRLEGQVAVSGAKNSVLRLLAGTLLTADRMELQNYPAGLLDAQIHVGMLEALGKTVTVSGDSAVISEADGLRSRLDWPGRSIRNTLLILGALAARTGTGEVPLPGGCKLGERKYDLHVMLLERLGATVTETETHLCASAPDGLVGNDIVLPMRSTGATENALLCGSLARGKTTIWGPHIRPEIMDLVAMLRSMGADISVFGQERIEVVGHSRLHGTTHRVVPDNMEALTWLIAATMTGGEVEIIDFPTEHLEVPLIFLRESGARWSEADGRVTVKGGTPFPVEISTGPYPGINSDMQPLFAVYSALSPGVSKIIDLRFPGRYRYAEELAKMGLDTATDGNQLTIKGGAPLQGAAVQAVDLRAGIALALAGFVADGQTVIHDAWQISRGYDRFVEKARALGAEITAE